MTSQPRKPDPHANGTSAFHPDAASLIGAAVGRQLAPMLDTLIGNLHAALGQVIATTPAKPMPCAACFLQRLNWEARHLAELRSAAMQAEFQTQVAMQAAAKMKAEAGELFDPATVQPLNPVDFLPDELKPHPEKPWDGDRLPQVLDAQTIAGGSLCCPFHIPGAPAPDGQLPAPQRPIILAPGGISLSAVAAMASRPDPNMPGTPGQ